MKAQFHLQCRTGLVTLHSIHICTIAKHVTDGASRAEYTDLLSEYTLLKEVDHPNVIKLLGAATLNGPFHLVVEYCEHGSLKSYLRTVRTLEPAYVNGINEFYTEHAQQLMAFSSQISKGMQYLSDIKVSRVIDVHGMFMVEAESSVRNNIMVDAAY